MCIMSMQLMRNTLAPSVVGFVYCISNFLYLVSFVDISTFCKNVSNLCGKKNNVPSNDPGSFSVLYVILLIHICTEEEIIIVLTWS